jgi:hypothetical protein
MNALKACSIAGGWVFPQTFSRIIGSVPTYPPAGKAAGSMADRWNAPRYSAKNHQPCYSSRRELKNHKGLNIKPQADHMDTIEKFITQMPKVELHVHLEGQAEQNIVYSEVTFTPYNQFLANRLGFQE